MRLCVLIPAILLACAAPAGAWQDAYGGGWAVPSLDTSIAITNEVGNRAVMQDILREDVNRGRPRIGRAGVARRASAPGGPGVFPSALQSSSGAPEAAPVETRFPRSAAVQREAQQNILAAIARRQPDAVPHYKQLFAQADMPRAFETVTKGYGLHADDAADAVTGYWVMAWVVANQAGLPSPASVQAARRQVVDGFARTPVGGYDAARRQILADEAIFNFLVLNQSWRNASEGKGGNLAELGDATQRNFLPLGADLRSLALGPDGFVRR